jgi:RHS repeat-associated protein
LAVTSVTGPAIGVPGQDATITYIVKNTLNFPTSASQWVDSVYLSLGDTVTRSARLVERVPHDGVVAGNSSYTERLTTPLPGVVPGNYHVIVVADSEGDVPDVNRANNTLASTSLVSMSMPPLPLGSPTSGTIDNGQDEFFQVNLPAGPVYHITADFAAAGGGELFVRYQDVPDSTTFDQVAFDPTQQDEQLVLNGTQAGTYYIWVHGREGSAGGKPFTITAQELAFQVLSVSPDHGSNTGPVTLTVQGSQFSPGTVVSLVGADGKSHKALSVLCKDNTTLFATFDLTGLALGSYAVQVQDSGQTVTGPEPFTVNTQPAGSVSFSLSCSAFTNNNTPGNITIDYANAGNTDVPAPLMILSGAASFQLPGETTPVSESVELLGINQGGPAGTLPPGYHGTITLSFLPDDRRSHKVTNFTLSTIPSADTPFDWSSVESDLQPPDVGSDAWAAIYQNFTAAVGTTLGQYQQALDNDATYLSQLGEYTVDVSRLLSFELQKADNFGAISQRYTLGAFGRGWPDPTDVKLTTDAAGNVTIAYSGRVRSFFVQPDGSYQGVPGDAATLTKETDSTYQLRETDGTMTAFHADGTLAYTEDTNGNKITANYTSGQLTSFVDSTGDTVSFTYNNQGRITQVTDPVGRATTYTYDPTGQYLLSVADATGTTSYAYVPGQGAPGSFGLASITYPDGSQTLFAYDARGRLTQQEADQGGDEKVTYSYDGEGGISVTDAGGGTSTYFVNEFEQVGAYEDPLGHFTHFTYDANHNLIKETDPDGITSTFTTDARGNPTRLVDPAGNQLSTTYDPTLSRLTSLTDPNGNTTQYSHDANGNLLAITYPDSSQEQFTYDPMGNLTESVDRNGTAIGYKYDTHNLLTEEDFADGSKITYTYDDHRNLLTATNSVGTTKFQYDSADRLIRVTYPNNMYLKFTYDPATGQRTQMVDQTGFTVNYQYDAVGRLSGLTDGKGNLIVNYTYDAAGRLSRKDMGNGTYTKYGYDLAGDLTSIVNYKPDNSALSQYVYAYEDRGDPISVTTLAGTTTYGYDATGQLTSVALPGGRTITYQYDAAGNRVAVTDSGVTTSYTTNDLNEYTQVGSTKYTYDKDGNLISQTGASGTTNYTYNALGQLVSVVSPMGTRTYQYDALGNRIAATQAGQQMLYLIDPTGIAKVVGTFGGSASVIEHYTQGLGLTSQISATGAAVYYNFDLTGNSTELTGPGGAVLNTYSYLPFGEQLRATGSTPNPFTYVGQFGVRTDGDGEFFMGSRTYDQFNGRFVQPDPIGVAGDVNLYRYAQNAPIDGIDPTGLQVIFAPGIRNVLGPTTEGQGHATSSSSSSPLNGILTVAGGLLEVGGGVALAGGTSGLGIAAGVFLIDHGLATIGFGIAQAISPSSDIPGGPFEAVLSENPQSREVGKTLDFATGLLAPDPARKAGIVASKLLTAKGVGDVISQPFYDLVKGYYDSRYARDRQDALGPLGNPILGPRTRELLKQKMKGTQNSTSRHLVNGDPNSLTGPAGFGTGGYITPTQTLPYTITFANEPTADIPVQQVVVTDQLDKNLDWTTFQVGDFSISGTTYHVPANTGSYSTRLDLTSTLGIYLDVSAGINLTTGLVTWTFSSVDPKTGDLPADIFTGFLPPDKTAPQGEAFVPYTVRPRAADTTGTPIRAQATVVFDTNAPINTPTVTNTIDAGPPTSSVNPLPAVTNASSFPVSWSGADPGGPGITAYDVYVSVDGGPFTPWLTGTAAASAVYTGAFGHSYAFYSVATDPLGFRQPTPPGAQASTLLQPPPPALPEPPHPVSIILRTRRIHKHRVLVAEVQFSDGLPPRDVVAPFQKPAFGGIQAVLKDLDGDGIFDSLLFTAHKGKRMVSRSLPV